MIGAMGAGDSPLFDAAAFAERFRGGEDEIRARLRPYLRFFRAPEREILDFGCGRGEFLDVARAAGLRARGVDRSPLLVERCHAKGHDAAAGDGFAALERCPDGSLGGLVAVHVVEHFELAELARLLELASRKLAPGGTLLLETPNPRHEVARRNFWLDPTHRRPLHPELLDFLAGRAGFARREIHYPGEDDYLLRQERRRRRSLWERLVGRRYARQAPAAAPQRLLDADEGAQFPDYGLVAWR
ncbi:MAG: methyltransferase domain-containing protein [Planctomycetota bacterium]|nr:MAG: methyltransferase domain-containing protein [Planctomycetota bacterium]